MAQMQSRVVVGEEERAVVAGRVRAAVVEGQTGDGRAAGSAALTGHRPCRCAGRRSRERSPRPGRPYRLSQMLRFAAVVAALAAHALVARPAEVATTPESGSSIRLISSQLFQPTSPTQTSLVPGRTREAERVAQPVGDDAVVARRRRRRAGCRRSAAPVSGSRRRMVPSRVDGVAGRPQVLAAQGAALGRGRRLAPAHARRRIAARVERAAVLAAVREVEAGAVAAADVEGPVGARRTGCRSSGSDTAGTSPRARPARCPSSTLPAGLQARQARPRPRNRRRSAPVGSGSRPSCRPTVPQRGGVPPIAASSV